MHRAHVRTTTILLNFRQLQRKIYEKLRLKVEPQLESSYSGVNE